MAWGQLSGLRKAPASVWAVVSELPLLKTLNTQQVNNKLTHDVVGGCCLMYIAQEVMLEVGQCGCAELDC